MARALPGSLLPNVGRGKLARGCTCSGENEEGAFKHALKGEEERIKVPKHDNVRGEVKA